MHGSPLLTQNLYEAPPHSHKASRVAQYRIAVSQACRRCSVLAPIGPQTTGPRTWRGRPIRKTILDELNSLCCEFDLLEHNAGNIAGGLRQACNVATSERIVIDGN